MTTSYCRWDNHGQRLLIGCLACLPFWTQGAMQETPELAWQYAAQSNLYTAPVVADLHPSPGLETLICDSAVRALLCIGAEGERLWSYAPGWKKRLISAPAVTLMPSPAIVIANGDGSLHCVDGATGEQRWARAAGAVEWGGALWAQLNETPPLEVVVGTEHEGVVAFSLKGDELWRTKASEDGPLHIRAALAAADVDRDGFAEVFGVDQRGPFSLGAKGEVRWRHQEADDFISAISVADLEGDGDAEVLCSSREDDFLWRFDATTGVVAWRAPLQAGPDAYAGSAIAAADLNGDGVAEVIAGDSAGRTYAISAPGDLLWTHEGLGRTHTTPIAAQVNGDEFLEVLSASGDQHVYGLSFAGVQRWQLPAKLRLTAAATVADIDLDGRAEVLACGNDSVLYCYQTQAAWAAGAADWPMRGFDATQCASSFGRDTRANHFEERLPLLENGGFELLKVTENPLGFPKTEAMEAARRQQPRGWTAREAEAAWGVITEGAFEGANALRTTAGASVVSRSLDVAAGLLSVEVQAQVKGAGELSLLWSGAAGALREDRSTLEGNAWTASREEGIAPPFGATSVQVLLEGDAQWDAVAVEARVRQRKSAQVLVNQAGYEPAAPKHFVVQANFPADAAHFAVVDQTTGGRIFSGELTAHGRIQGHFGNDWGYEYWRGDFSDFGRPGKYRLVVTMEGIEFSSYPITIADDALWDAAARPAYRFFYYQRCGDDIPGYHAACHLDDAVGSDGVQYELWGGWHDAGDYNTYHNAPYLLGLARAYGMEQPAFLQQDEDGNGQDEFLEELLWGAAHVTRMLAEDGSAHGPITSGYGFWGPPELETDNTPGTGDERPISGGPFGHDPSQHHAALARVAAYVQDRGSLVAAAERGLRYAIAHNIKGLAQFSTALDLYALTGAAEYEMLARELAPAPSASVEVVEALERFDRQFGTDHREALREALVARAEEMLALAQNPFGVYTFGPAEQPNFYGTPGDKAGWHVGTSSHLMQAAALMALAHDYQPDPRYRQFVWNQFNWVFGVNPYNISLMEGVGTAFPPSYHHRYTYSGVPRGAVPGGLVNGITWRGVGDDRPSFDMSGVDIPAFESNEVWLPHNTNFLTALVLKQRAERADRSAN